MHTDGVNNGRSGGVSGALAALLGLLALAVGLMSGLLLGGAGGFMLGRQLASDGASSAIEMRAGEASAAARSLADRGRTGGADQGQGRDQNSTTPGGGGLGQVPAVPAVPAEPSIPGMPDTPGMPSIPGLPGITVVGPQSAVLGVEVNTPSATSDGSTEGDGAAQAPAGAMVLSVQEGSAAEAAGLQPDDLIVAVDDEPVASAAELAAVIAKHEPDDVVTVHFVRDGAEKQVEATLGQNPAVVPLDPQSSNLDDLLNQMPPEMRDHFRELLQRQSDDTGA